MYLVFTTHFTLLHCRVLSLRRCQTVVIEMKPATYVLKVIPLIMPGQPPKNGIDFAIIFETWHTLNLWQ